MDAIRIHPGPFTGRDSLPKLLEVFKLTEETTESIMSSCNLTQMIKSHQDNGCPSTLIVNGKRFQLTSSFLFYYLIYVEENPSPDTGRNDIAEMVTPGRHCVFGEAIAVRPSNATKKPVDSKEFVSELRRVIVNDFLVTLPMRHFKDSKDASPSRNLNVLGRFAIL